ncbi:MAG: zinc ribbon domain-containing protein [Planctomycetaceae bacterium]|nr:zinc ribbon domain-containing protein [Planctomycetaceae bacterium]
MWPDEDFSNSDTECPNCGSLLKPNAHHCRECGASAEYRWGRADPEDFVDDDDFDYDEFVAHEFPEHAPPKSHGIQQRFWVIVLIIALAIAVVASL